MTAVEQLAELMRSLHVGLIGDYRTHVTAHRAIPPALQIASGVLGCAVQETWLPTTEMAKHGAIDLARFDGFWSVPATPCRSTDEALRAPPATLCCALMLDGRSGRHDSLQARFPDRRDRRRHVGCRALSLSLRDESGFQPERSALAGQPHPLVVAFVRALST